MAAQARAGLIYCRCAGAPGSAFSAAARTAPSGACPGLHAAIGPHFMRGDIANSFPRPGWRSLRQGFVPCTLSCRLPRVHRWISCYPFYCALGQLRCYIAQLLPSPVQAFGSAIMGSAADSMVERHCLGGAGAASQSGARQGLDKHCLLQSCAFVPYERVCTYVLSIESEILQRGLPNSKKITTSELCTGRRAAAAASRCLQHCLKRQNFLAFSGRLSRREECPNSEPARNSGGGRAQSPPP